MLDKLKDFLIELGPDFCFVGSEYPLQVGGQDFALDLLFFHRESSLVAVELKVGRFEPEYLGKLAFYLEALDRDVRKPHEHPSIGVLLCASKNDEVVEYALSRTLSPALIAEYQTQLPDKRLLQAKLHEFLPSERARRAWKATTCDRETPHAEKGSVDHSEPNRIEFERRRLNALIGVTTPNVALYLFDLACIRDCAWGAGHSPRHPRTPRIAPVRKRRKRPS